MRRSRDYAISDDGPALPGLRLLVWLRVRPHDPRRVPQLLYLILRDAHSQFKGTGTVNGACTYKFMIWATDNGTSGDAFRSKSGPRSTASRLSSMTTARSK
jgi:hypothetical protein